MKAAPEDQLLLLDVQRLDNEITRIAHRITALQKGADVAAAASRAAALRGELAGATGDLEDAERELARLESDTATARARVERDTTMLNATSNPKAAAGFESELANLARRISELEDSELAVMERIETHRARVGDLEARLADADVEQQRLSAERDKQIGLLVEGRERFEADRRTVTAKVPDDLLALYERQRARYGFGASLLQGGVSTASGVALGSSDLAAVRAAAPDDVLLCPDSDAILVRTAESGL